MSELLIPYDQFDTDDLGEQLHDLVSKNVRHLTRRNLKGVVVRYGKDLNQAKKKVEKGQIETANGTLKHYVIDPEGKGEARGMTSFFPRLPLVRVSLPLKPRLLPNALVHHITNLGPNITAWEGNQDEDLLRRAYVETLLKANEEKYKGVAGPVWTTEPLTSETYVKRAIVSSGFVRQGVGQYYDGEASLIVTPSTLYTASIEIQEASED